MSWWRTGKRPDERVPEPDLHTEPEPDASAPRREDRILGLQRLLGNQAVQRMLPPSAGEPIQESERQQLETSLGTDLGEVRIHRDQDAADLASGAGANAVTSGRDIYFASGAYSPGTLAHEAAHVVQQAQADSLVSAEDIGLEHEADRASSAIIGRQMAPISAAPAVPAMQRQEAPGANPFGIKLMPDWSVTLDHFDIDKFELSAGHKQQLDKFAERVKSRMSVVRELNASIVGFADAPGTDAHNRALGQQRADAVKTYLLGKGVPENILSAGSLGEEVLAVETQRYEAKNRRVEIYVHERSFEPIHLTPPSAPISPIAPQKTIDLTYHPPMPTPQEEMEENLRRNLEIDKLAHEIMDREKSKPGTSISDVFGKAARELTRKMGLPKWVQDRAESLGQSLPASGAKAVFDQITADKNLSESEKNAVHNAIEALMKTKIK